MADISILSRLVNGFQRNVDLTQNSLVVGSIKIGATSPAEITKAIAEKLIAVQAAADADGTFDTRYHTKSALAANGGAALIGSSTGSTVESRITALEGAVGTGTAEDISYDNTDSGLTATNVQAAIDEVEGRLETAEAQATAAIPATEKGAVNGVATLDGGGKIPVSQLPSAVMTLEGEWDASTNTPTLANGSGDPGMVYEATVAGTVDFGDGPFEFNVGDWVVYGADGKWYKSVNSNEVTSVNGFTGPVELDTDDIDEGAVNKYFTDEKAQDAVGGILQNTTTVNLTYNDAGNQISAEVNNDSIGPAKLTSAVADQKTVTGGNGAALQVQEAPKLARTMTVGESIADDETFAVRLAVDGETAARVYKADIDASTDNLFFVMGLARKEGGASAGDPVEVVYMGPYVLGANDTPFQPEDIGKPVYLDASGAITLVPPSAVNTAVYKVGMVEDVNIIMIAGMQLHGIN